MNQYRYSNYNEPNEMPKKVSRPTSALSVNDNHSNDFSKQIPQRRTIESESRSLMISPIEMPSSYDMFESGLPKSNSSATLLRSTSAATGYGGTSNTAPSNSNVSFFFFNVPLCRLLFCLFRMKQY